MSTNIPNILKDKMLTVITATFWMWFGRIYLKISLGHLLRKRNSKCKQKIIVVGLHSVKRKQESKCVQWLIHLYL